MSYVQASNTSPGTDRLTAVNPKIRFDTSYAYTLPGILKAVQMIANLIGCLLVFITIHGFDGGISILFKVVALTGFCISGVFLIICLFRIGDRFQKVPWMKIEFIYCLIMTGCNAVAAALLASLGTHDTLSAAAFFGFCAMVAYGMDAFLKYFIAYKTG